MSFKIRRYKAELPLIELSVYYLFCILSLGIVWVSKIVLKKAMAESVQDTETRKEHEAGIDRYNASLPKKGASTWVAEPKLG